MASGNMNRRNIGLNPLANGQVEARLWAPLAKSAALETEQGRTISLQAMEHGYWHALADAIKPGEKYHFLLDNERKLPDPASLSQPDGVHGPSQYVDLQAFQWEDSKWTNPALGDYIFYEIHTGVFSPESNFKGIIAKLDHLA